MIQWYQNMVLTSYPAQFPWDWKCGCGHSEEGGIEMGKTIEDRFQETWEGENS